MRKEKNKDSTLYIVIIIGCLIIGGFYFLTELSKQKTIIQLQREEYLKEQSQKNEDDRKEKEIESKYNECMNDAYNIYTLNWNTSCKSRNLPDDCQLLSDIASRLDEEKKRQEDICLQLYKR